MDAIVNKIVNRKRKRDSLLATQRGDELESGSDGEVELGELSLESLKVSRCEFRFL